MIWVRCLNERFVNINNWDFMEAVTISDIKTGHPIIYKIFLSKNNEQYVLGYLNIKDNYIEDVLQKISKGIDVDFSTLNSCLYFYLYDEFDELYGNMSSEKDWEKDRETRMIEIDKLIGKRFVEDE